MVRALGLHPARLADTEWNPHHIGAFDPNGRRGLDGLVRPLGGRTLAARAVVGAVHDPQTMNGEAAGMVPKAIADGQPLKQFGFKKQGPKQKCWALPI